MTQRTEMQHRVLEFKSAMMALVANRLFSFRQNGLDGFLKRKMLGEGKKPAAPKVEEGAAVVQQ